VKQPISIVKSVGKHGVNRSKDVTVLQTRLNQWIAAGKLPGLAVLVVDGKCGPKTKQAIGAFQLRYVAGLSKPDCRADPGGKTVTHLGLDFGEVSKRVGDPVYDGWLETPTDTSDDTPYWKKRGMFWYGVGAKAGAGSSGASVDGTGVDLTMAAMYNLKNEDNRFQIAATTQRYITAGGGFAGSVVLCFATGIYHPHDFNSIKNSGVDWNFAVGAKWLSFARWAMALPKMSKLISAVTAAKYANGDTVSELATLIKGGIAGFDLSEDDTRPSFVAIDLPFAGAGLEASLYYGVTSYRVLSSHLV
jgi:peptidoglycan hydrolase-like protein with peptidoglycan-binding domain